MERFPLSDQESLLLSMPVREPMAHARAIAEDLLQGVDAIIWEMNAQTWQFTFVSARAENILGYPVSRWMTEPTFWQDVLLHPDDRDWAVNYCVTATNESRDHEFLYRARHADGHIVWLKDVVRVERGPDGAAMMLRGVMIDVSAEKRAEEEKDRQVRQALEESRAHLGLALEAGAMGTWEWDIVANRVIWSPQEERLYGLTPGSFSGTVEEYRSRIHPDDVADSWARVAEAMERRQSHHHVLHRIVRPDGDVRWLDSHARFIYDESGRPLRLVGVSTDVTEQRERERQLIESEARFQALVDATAQYIWTNDAEGRMTVVQPGWARLTGQSPDQYAGYGWADALHPDDANATLDAWQRAVATRSNFEVEHRVRRQDGVYRHFWVRAVPVLNADNTIREWVGIHTDITERKALEADRDRALRDVEFERSRLQDVFAQAPSAIGVTRGAEHRMVVANERFQELVGPRPLVGRTVREAFPEMEGQPFFDLLDNVYREGAPFFGYETPALIDRDGDGVTEEYLFNFTYQPLRDVDGTTSGILIHAVDVTQQVRARQEIERLAGEVDAERTRLAELLEQAPAAISMTRGPDHVGVMQNAIARRLGGRDTVGRPVREVFPELEGHGLFEMLDDVYRTGRAISANEVYVEWDRDGDGVIEAKAYFNVVYQPVRDRDGSIHGVLTHSVEVSDQVRARQEIEAKAEELARLTEALERSNRELDQFAYVASHDLKAPLRGIANLTQWIEEDLGERVTGDSANHMRLLKVRVHRMEALIDGILTYSRAARTRVKPEAIDSRALVSDVVDLLAPPPDVVTVGQGLPTLRAERVPLQQVFMNLISNALKHGRAEAPRVWVDATSEDEEIHFTVRDNGRGIPPEYHERIWGIFQTLEARDTVESTGIGLAVVKKIVESRGGRAWVESATGEGATFHFTWPKQASTTSSAS